MSEQATDHLQHWNINKIAIEKNNITNKEKKERCTRKIQITKFRNYSGWGQKWKSVFFGHYEINVVKLLLYVRFIKYLFI